MPNDKDLSAVGIPPKSAVRELLENAADLPKAIEEFQAENALALGSLHSILKIYDLHHNVRRFDFNQTVINSLAEKLAEKVRELGKRPDGQKKLEALLNSAFRLHEIPQVRPIVLETLRQLPKVSSKIVKKILEDKTLYDESSVSVKQQIWLAKEHLSFFTEAVEPLLDSYVDEKEKLLTVVARSSVHFFNCDTSKSRRQWKQLKGTPFLLFDCSQPSVFELISMIGLHEKLFHRLVDMIRERFEKIDSPHYCSLRSEIVMCLHDQNVDYIVQQDPTHDFVWVLHAIVRDRHLDNQQTTKLKGLLDKKKVAEANLGSMAMAAADPYVLYFLCISAIRVLTEHARQCTSLPRESPLLQVVVRLLYLGTSASRILNERISEQKAVVDVQCLTRFLPLLLARMAADRFRAELKRAPEELSNEFIGEVAERPLDEVEEFVSADVVPALFLLSYVLELLATKRRLFSAHPLVDYLRVLCEAKDKITMQDPWAHVLAARLIQSPSADVLFADPDFVHVVVHLFTTGIQHNPNNRFHLLRLCNALHAQLGNDVVERIMQAITPADGLTHEPEYAGQSSAARFPKELRRFIAQRARKETSSPPPPEVPIPIVDAPALSPDLLSKMLDEE